jgi:hypothetical protein
MDYQRDLTSISSIAAKRTSREVLFAFLDAELFLLVAFSRREPASTLLEPAPGER